MLPAETHKDSTATMLEWSKLLGVLAQSSTTPMGKRKALAITKPTDISRSRSSLQQTLEATKLLYDKSWQPNFNDIADIVELLQQIKKGGHLDRQTLYEVYVTLNSADYLVGSFDKTLKHGSVLAQIITRFRPLDELLTTFRGVFDARGMIRDDATPVLQDLRSRLDELNRMIHEKLTSLLKRRFPEEYFQDDYITIREDRLVLPMKANMKGKFRGIIHGASNTGQTYFIEPEEVVQANNDFKVLCQEERQEVENILKHCSDVLRSYDDDIIKNMEVVSDLDLLVAKAKLSMTLKGSMPELTDKNQDYILRKARHPLLCLLGQRVVASDILIPKDCYCLVISGPNAGGKTVTLKTIGLNTLLAANGILPAVAEGSCLPCCDKLLVDIGDKQSLESGLSTFSAHLQALADITKHATSASLVLLDEVVTGTNALEGSALAQALLETLVRKKVKTVVTTHYPNLKRLALSNQGFKNASMETDSSKGSPTYRLIHGVSGSSHAIEVARLSGIDAKIIDRAGELLGSAQQDLNAIEDEKRIWENKQQELDKKQQQLATLEKDLRRNLASLEEKSAAELSSEYTQFKKDLAEARRRLREILPSLRREKSLGLKRTIDGVAKKAVESVEKIIPATESKPPKVGDHVRLLETEQLGVVSRGVNRQGILEATIGSVRMQLHQDEVEVAAEPQPKQAQMKEYRKKAATDEVVEVPLTQQSHENTIDLRGRSLEDALVILEKFLDRSTLHGPDNLIVIHGHGSNRLKTGLRDYLGDSPYPLHFRSGREGEGGSGVTVILLSR